MNKLVIEQFWDRIRKLIKLNCTTQKELSKKLGYKESYLVSAILQKISPNVELLIKLSDYFEVSIDYLLKGTDDNNFTNNNSSDLIENIKRQVDIKNYRLASRERSVLENKINNLKNKLTEIKQLSTL